VLVRRAAPHIHTPTSTRGAHVVCATTPDDFAGGVKCTRASPLDCSERVSTHVWSRLSLNEMLRVWRNWTQCCVMCCVWLIRMKHQNRVFSRQLARIRACRVACGRGGRARRVWREGVFGVSARFGFRCGSIVTASLVRRRDPSRSAFAAAGCARPGSARFRSARRSGGGLARRQLTDFGAPFARHRARGGCCEGGCERRV
jgi:hypothetical protein